MASLSTGRARDLAAWAGRHYGPADLGPACPVCGTATVAALQAAGISVHPACGEVTP